VENTTTMGFNARKTNKQTNRHQDEVWKRERYICGDKEV
jgi:hypothetical protein